jgi:hypothetical protein
MHIGPTRHVGGAWGGPESSAEKSSPCGPVWHERIERPLAMIDDKTLTYRLIETNGNQRLSD